MANDFRQVDNAGKFDQATETWFYFSTKFYNITDWLQLYYPACRIASIVPR